MLPIAFKNLAAREAPQEERLNLSPIKQRQA